MCTLSTSRPAFNATSTHGDTASASTSVSASNLTTSYTAAGAHADRTKHSNALHMCYQPSSLELTGSSQISSATVQSAQSSALSSARPLVAPSMVNRTSSEQAVIQALQAVANYPESRDFVESMSRTLPGLQTLLDSSFAARGLHASKSVSRAQYVGSP